MPERGRSRATEAARATEPAPWRLRETIGTWRRWQLQDAKSQFSELVQRALDGTPSVSPNTAKTR
jgi:hypothetical protein